MILENKMTNKVIVKDREIVIPGDILAEGLDYLPSGRAFRDKDKLYASSMGLVNIKGRVIKVIPLAGKYLPAEMDAVIGTIVSTGKHGWQVNINAPTKADLNILDASNSYIDKRRAKPSDFFQKGDIAFAGVDKISENGYVSITMKGGMYKKLIGGVTISISPTKIPRVIGKQGSMIKTLKDKSKCDILVGQNGIVWMKGEPEMLFKLTKAIKLIEKESHTSGLTERITKLLGGKK